MKVVVCPGCQARLKIADDSVTRFACPKCKKEMRIASKAIASGQSTSSPTLPPKPQPAPARPVAQSSSTPASPQRRNATAPSQSQPLQTDLFSDQDILGSTQPSAPYGAIGATGNGYAAPKKSRLTSKGRDPKYKTFLKWLGIGLGAFCLLILLALPLTFVPGSPLSIIPALLAFLGALGLATAASIWFVVEGFKKSVLDGVLILFVPYYWIYFLITNRNLCRRPFAVFGASLVPALLCVIIVNFFKPDVARRSSSDVSFATNPGGSFPNGASFPNSVGQGVPSNLAPGQVFPNARIESSTRPSPLSNMEPTMPVPGTPSMAITAEQRRSIHEMLKRQSNSGKSELVTARVEVFSVMGNDATTAAEKCLLDLPGYVPGSFKLAADQKSVTFQYRGDRENALSYAALLTADAGIMIRLEATFE